MSKYFARKTACRHDHVHGSKKEARRCEELHLLWRAGEIADLEQQPKFVFAIDGKTLKHGNGHKVGYTADFRYREKGRPIVEEVKGYTVRDWPLRKAIFEALYPDIELRVV